MILLLLQIQHVWSGWPSGLRRCVQVAVHFCGRGFESHFWQIFLLHIKKVIVIVRHSFYSNQHTDSRVAQWKRAGPITQRSVDRNYALLIFLGVKINFLTFFIHNFSIVHLILSGWPSGLRRQTQGILPCSHDRGLYRDFWSSYEGVGSNPTSDSNILIFFYTSLGHVLN